MNWTKVFQKGFGGLVTTLVAVFAGQLDQLSNLVVSLVPEQYATMTVAAIVGSLITAGVNWFKHSVLKK